jgi:hypothetical protein
MQTMREWLVAQNLAKPGRGRFSAEAKAALAKAIGEGMQFSDSTKVSVKTENGKETVKTEKTPAAEVTGPTPDKRYINDNWTTIDGKVKVSERAVCTTCKHSLAWHFCGNPWAMTSRGEIEPVKYAG